MSLEEAFETEKKRLAELEERVKRVKDFQLTETLVTALNQLEELKKQSRTCFEEYTTVLNQATASITDLFNRILAAIEKSNPNADLEREVLQKINREL